MIKAIDPGAAGKGNAVAAFVNDHLMCVGFERIGDARRPFLGGTPDTVVIERPEYQGDRTTSARPQDLMALAWSGALLAGAYVGAGAALVEYTPREWKGSVPKPVHHKRLWEVLAPGERALLGGPVTIVIIDAACRKGGLSKWSRPGASYYPRSFELHNILDAVGLGLFHIGRFGKGGA